MPWGPGGLVMEHLSHEPYVPSDLLLAEIAIVEGFHQVEVEILPSLLLTLVSFVDVSW